MNRQPATGGAAAAQPGAGKSRLLRGAPRGRERICKRGTLLFIEGEEGKEMYVVRTGKVRLLKQEGESSSIVEVCGPGSVIGEMSLLAGEARPVTAQVVEESSLLIVDGDLFSATIKSLPSWIGSAFQSLVRRWIETTKQAGEEIVQKSIASAIRVMLLFAEIQGKKENNELMVSLARLREELFTITGLGDAEIENVFLHLIMKRLLRIRKDSSDQEVVVIDKPNIVYLYLSYLRSRQRGEAFPGEHLPPAAFSIIDLLLSSDAGGKSIKKTAAQIEEDWRRSGKNIPFDAEAFSRLIETGNAVKEGDGSLLFNSDRLQLLRLSGTWLPVFKEEVKF